jgi:hypothetical protein
LSNFDDWGDEIYLVTGAFLGCGELLKKSQVRCNRLKGGHIILRMVNKVVVPAVILLAVLIAAGITVFPPPNALAGGQARVIIIDANGKAIMKDPLLWIANPGKASADSGSQGAPADSLTIKVGYFGGPFYTKKVYTVSDLEAMPQVKQAYTYIDNMPAVVIDSGKGVKFADLLADAGIDVNSIEKFYFYATDVKHGWYEDLDKPYLLDNARYYYPNLPAHWDYGTQMSMPGATSGAIKVDTIITYQDNWERFVTAPDFSIHDTSTRFRLLFGQTDASTPTASRSVRWVHEIDVMLGGAPPSGVALNQNLANIKVGSTFQLTATITPGDATDKSVTWTSSDPKVATVDSNGLVTVVGPGTATITVSTVVGDKTATCIVNGPNRNDSGQGAVGAGASVHKGGGQGATGGPLVPESNQQHLERSGVAAVRPAPANTVFKQSDSQPWRVYEMSSDAVPLQLQKDQGGLDLYLAAVFLALFILGLARKYTDYAREIRS